MNKWMKHTSDVKIDGFPLSSMSSSSSFEVILPAANSQIFSDMEELSTNFAILALIEKNEQGLYGPLVAG